MSATLPIAENENIVPNDKSPNKVNTELQMKGEESGLTESSNVIGRVKFFNRLRGYGFIIRSDTTEPIFFHVTAIITKNPESILPYIKRGGLVEFNVVKDPEVEGGFKAINITYPGGEPISHMIPGNTWLELPAERREASPDRRRGRSRSRDSRDRRHRKRCETDSRSRCEYGLDTDLVEYFRRQESSHRRSGRESSVRSSESSKRSDRSCKEGDPATKAWRKALPYLSEMLSEMARSSRFNDMEKVRQAISLLADVMQS